MDPIVPYLTAGDGRRKCQRRQRRSVQPESAAQSEILYLQIHRAAAAAGDHLLDYIVATHLLQINVSQEQALKVRRIAGLILPIAFIITQTVLFFTFHISG